MSIVDTLRTFLLLSSNIAGDVCIIIDCYDSTSQISCLRSSIPWTAPSTFFLSGLLPVGAGGFRASSMVLHFHCTRGSDCTRLHCVHSGPVLLESGLWRPSHFNVLLSSLVFSWPLLLCFALLTGFAPGFWSLKEIDASNCLFRAQDRFMVVKRGRPQRSEWRGKRRVLTVDMDCKSFHYINVYA